MNPIKKTNTLLATAWMMGAVVSFSAMAVAGREMSSELNTFEIMTYRSIIGAVVMIMIITWFRLWDQIRIDKIYLHSFRNLIHFIGQNLWFYALTLIPLSHLFAFEFSVPIWVTIAAPFLLAERLTPLRIISVIIGFVGILIVTRPWAAGLSIGIIAAALCAIAFAGTAITTKQLTQTQSITCILFWMTVIQLILSMICTGYDGKITLPSSDTALWIVIVGVAGLFAHLCITSALKLAPATIVMPIDFTRLPLIAIIGMIFYNEPLDLWVIVGAIIIFGSNYLNIWSEKRQNRIDLF